MPRSERGGAAVFVSYSRQDAALVTPIVKLIRTTRRLVFQDIDSLRAGERWRPQIEDALRAARLVVVFWCNHAQSSTYVAQEYQRAISWQKEVVPVLLDPTPLPDDLGEFQAVDFRDAGARLHSAYAAEPTRNLRARHPWALRIAVIVACLAFLVALFSWFVAKDDALPRTSSAPSAESLAAEREKQATEEFVRISRRATLERELAQAARRAAAEVQDPAAREAAAREAAAREAEAARLAREAADAARVAEAERKRVAEAPRPAPAPSAARAPGIFGLVGIVVATVAVVLGLIYMISRGRSAPSSEVTGIANELQQELLRRATPLDAPD